MKKVIYRQPFGKLGCGSYCLANLFNDERFITNVPEKYGERVVDLNKKMADFKSELYLECIYLTHHNMQAGNRMRQPELFHFPTNYTDQSAGYVKPYLITVVNRRQGLHMILVLHDLMSDIFYIVDSVNEFVFEVNINQLVMDYHIVGVTTFGIWGEEHPANFACIEKSQLSHLID